MSTATDSLRAPVREVAGTAHSQASKYLGLTVLGLSGGAIYVFPYLKYVFYDQMLSVGHMSNTQAGLLLSVYAIGSMVLYIPGGVIADRIAPRRALALSLAATTGLTVLYASTFSFAVALLIWTLLAFSSSFVFWSALMKAISIMGTEAEQGRLYGFYYAVNGLSAALLSWLSLKVDNSFSSQRQGFFWAVMTMAIVTGLLAVLCAVVLRGEGLSTVSSSGPSERFRRTDVTAVIRNPTVWLVSVLFFCIYGIYTSQSYFAPYLSDVLHISSTNSSLLAIVRTYGFMLLAPVAGLIADRVLHSTLRWFLITLTIVAVFIVALLASGASMGATMASAVTLGIGLFSLLSYCVMFSTLSEVGIPRTVAATAIGLVSIFGYAPDLVLNPLFGHFLDASGNARYKTIFATLITMGVMAVATSLVLLRRSRDRRTGPSLDQERI